MNNTTISSKTTITHNSDNKLKNLVVFSLKRKPGGLEIYAKSKKIYDIVLAANIRGNDDKQTNHGHLWFRTIPPIFNQTSLGGYIDFPRRTNFLTDSGYINMSWMISCDLAKGARIGLTGSPQSDKSIGDYINKLTTYLEELNSILFKSSTFSVTIEIDK